MSLTPARGAALILNYRRAHDTLGCLEALLAGTPCPGLLVVCDNASGDGSLERLTAWARERFPPERRSLPGEPPLATCAGSSDQPALLLLANPANLGFAAGNNPGIRAALDLGADLVWLLNPDTLPAPDAWQALLDCAAASPDTGIFGASVVRGPTPGSPARLECAGGFRFHPLSTRLEPAHGDAPLDLVPVLPEPLLDYVHGAAMLVRAEVFRAAGLLCEDFFLYYEELDLARRARAHGFTLAWCREAVVVHAGAASLGGPGYADPDLAALAQYHENRSTLLYLRRHHPMLAPWAGLARLAAKHVVLVLRGRASLLKPVWQAYLDVARNAPWPKA